MYLTEALRWARQRVQDMRVVDSLSVRFRNKHVVDPQLFGDGPHDCAPYSLYWAVAALPERMIVKAFHFETANWPYAGVTNSEFDAVVKYLGLSYEYTSHDEKFRDVLGLSPSRCIVLFHGHFAPVLDGRAYGRDAHFNSRPDARVICKWVFH